MFLFKKVSQLLLGGVLLLPLIGSNVEAISGGLLNGKTVSSTNSMYGAHNYLTDGKRSTSEYTSNGYYYEFDLTSNMVITSFYTDMLALDQPVTLKFYDAAHTLIATRTYTISGYGQYWYGITPVNNVRYVRLSGTGFEIAEFDVNGTVVDTTPPAEVTSLTVKVKQ